MVLPPLLLIKLQTSQPWLRSNLRLVLPVNLALILATSLVALPLALGAFPQRQRIKVARLEEGVRRKAAERDGGTEEVEFNRGI